MIIESVISGPDICQALDAIAVSKWQPGHSHHQDYQQVVKRNEELRRADNAPLKIVLDDLQRKILSNRRFSQLTFAYKTASLRFNRCKDGGFYGRHADASVMGKPPIRSDLSMTLWLTEDYAGGELCIDGLGEFKGKPGDILVYPSCYVHEVKPVTKGERICAVMWIQSMIRDQAKREHLTRFYDFGVRMKEREHLSPEYIEVTSLYNNLLRMWAEL